MKKHTLLFSNLIIILAIVAGFISMVYRDTKAYQDLAESHLENVLRLADTDISKYVENAMTKPVMVSKTMANDEFLKSWLMQEPSHAGDDAYLKHLYAYLKTYQHEYDYTTVFCVSAQTGNYYYQDGLNKTVSREDGHDVWYYNFTDSGHEYDLEVDTNQANGNKITVFVNFRIESDDGMLLGVIGVGLQVDLLEDMIRAYENNYDLSVYIVNKGGAKNSFTGTTDIFVGGDELTARTGIKEKIVMNDSAEPKIQWYTSGDARKCLITKYDKTLSWYLVLEKDTNSISSTFQKSIESNIAFMLITLVACIFVSTTVFISYNRRLMTMENTDELTGLRNRKLLYKLYPGFVRKHRDTGKSLFMLDIDHFKEINDTYGHLFGNAILSIVGQNLRSALGDDGIAARWGGDEFLGILAVPPEEAKRILGRFMDALKNEEKAGGCQVTVSIGIAEITGRLSTEQLIQKADEALYRSKEDGRNRITVSTPE